MESRGGRGNAITKLLNKKDQKMKTKTKIILKSMADLPANTLALAASVPPRAIEMTKQVLTPPVRATRRQVRAARQHSVKFIKDLTARANTPFKLTIPESYGGWSHGGLND